LKPSGLINVLSSGNSSDVDSVAVADMMVHKSKILFFLVFDENGRDFTERKTQEAKGICLHNAIPFKRRLCSVIIIQNKLHRF